MRGWNASRAWVKIAGEVLAIKFPELEMSFLTTIRGPFLFLCGVALSGGVGAQQDLAAWRQGDIWNMRDDFKMVLDDQGIVAELPSTARYELRLASVGDEVIAGSGTYQVYRRSRQNNSANTPNAQRQPSVLLAASASSRWSKKKRAPAAQGRPCW